MHHYLGSPSLCTPVSSGGGGGRRKVERHYGAVAAPPPLAQTPSSGNCLGAIWGTPRLTVSLWAHCQHLETFKDAHAWTPDLADPSSCGLREKPRCVSFWNIPHVGSEVPVR